MRWSWWTALSAAAGIVWGLASPQSAEAIPAFARKYSLSCTACHEAWPKLNDFGRAFRDNGYRLKTGTDDPTDQVPAYWPVSLRTSPGYSYTTTSNQATDEGLRALKTGSFEHPEADILTGGTVGSKVSFLAVIAGFGKDSMAAIESAWVRLDDLGGTSWLNLKLGKHEVDQPRSGHRSLTLTQGYLVYSHRPGGDANSLDFDLAENQLGIELAGHDRGSHTRYAVSLVTANGALGSNAFISSPTLYAHATHRFQPAPRGLRQVRIGAFGALGWSPSRFATEGGQPLPGSGHDNKRFSRMGGELGLWFGPLATPAAITAVLARGSEARELFAESQRDAIWYGGFVQAEATPRLSMTVFSRYDWIRNHQQPLDGFASSYRDEDALTGGLRYALVYSNRAAAAWHAEYTWRRTRAIGAAGLDIATRQFFAAIDFAF